MHVKKNIKIANDVCSGCVVCVCMAFSKIGKTSKLWHTHVVYPFGITTSTTITAAAAAVEVPKMKRIRKGRRKKKNS